MDINNLKGLMEAYAEVHAPQEVDEAVKGESSERRSDLAAERRAGRRPKSAKEGERYASHKLSQMAYAKRQRMGEEVEEVDEAVKGASRHDAEMRKASAAERRGGDKRLSPSKGKGYADQQKQQISYMDKLTKKNKNIIVGMTHEELDIFDTTLAELMEQGYTKEEAFKIMANPTD